MPKWVSVPWAGVRFIAGALPVKRNASLAQPAQAGCLFCMLDNRQVNQVLIENRTCYVRRDNFPAASGHVEVVPKRHVVSFFDLTAREVRDVYDLMKRARDQITPDVGTDDYTIGVNEGPAAGRTIDHLHIHLIPRRRGDVKDPRGGVRQVVPNGYHPDAWSEASAPQVDLLTPEFASTGRTGR